MARHSDTHLAVQLADGRGHRIKLEDAGFYLVHLRRGPAQLSLDRGA